MWGVLHSGDMVITGINKHPSFACGGQATLVCGEARDGSRCPLQVSWQSRVRLMPSIAANLRCPCSYPIVKVFGTAGQRCVTLNLGKSENQLWFETFRFQRSYICMNLL